MAIERPVSCHLVAWPALADGVAGAGVAGFSGCEVFASVALAFADSLGEMLGAAGLALSAVYAGGALADAGRRKEVVAHHVEVARLARSLGCDRLVLGPGPWLGRDRPDVRVVAASAQEVARAVADAGVVACLHPHPGTEVASAGEFLEVLERDASGFLGACPDTAHLTLAGDDPVAVIERCAERLAAVHLKDVRDDGRFCALGAGVVDVAATFAALDDIGYHGWVTVEVEDATPGAVSASKECVVGLGRWPETATMGGCGSGSSSSASRATPA